jgi:hypothetical protein
VTHQLNEWRKEQWAALKNILVPRISRCGRWLIQWCKFPLHILCSPRIKSLSQIPTKQRLCPTVWCFASAGRRFVGAGGSWDGQQGVASVLLRSRKRISVNQRHRDSGRHSNLKVGQAPGRNGIPNMALQHSVQQAMFFPPAWKHDWMLPIPKPVKGPALPLSHRPVSLLDDWQTVWKDRTHWHPKCPKRTLTNVRWAAVSDPRPYNSAAPSNEWPGTLARRG